ncbi:MAG TPA: arginine--tRNA ligase, partial [Verrucomicrobiae bacterium]|nr:arginine--tRNA ligase [Verrucomicrobiae bacterium]
MRDRLAKTIADICKDLFGTDVRIELTRPEEKFGDFSTNAALQLAGKLGTKPREAAEKLAAKLREDLGDQVSEVTVAGPGFINLKLSDRALFESLETAPAQRYAGQEVLVEFGDPNPFKAMHVGHLYSYIVGDAIASLLETAGAQVKRLSYHGDVGLHVAKALWAMQKSAEPPKGDIGRFYAEGAQAYERDEQAKAQIDALNAQIYANDPSLKELYDQGKKLSFDDFDAILKTLGIRTDRRYLESESTPVGMEMVRRNTGKVFKESEGAIVYEGEKSGLHTRVFLTSKGLPTYETKDLGLAELKHKEYPQVALSVIITAHEQAEYFKVMLAALGEIQPELAKKTKHLSHGFVSLSSGKMSSRTGEVYGAGELLADVAKAAKKQFPNSARDMQLGAVKYAFTRHRLGGDIVYDVNESISLEGNSGPYLQYAHARARSVLQKASN